MSAYWQMLSARLDGLSARERMLTLLVGLVLMILPLYTFWLEPSWLALQRKEQDNQQLQAAIRLQEQENRALSEALLQDPNLKLREQMALTRERIAQLDAQLQSQMVDLIPAAQMPGLLQSMLAHSEHLTLLELKSLPPQPLMDGDKALPLYQHRIRLHLKGRYFDLLQYLRTLEALPGHFYWQALDYQVQRYPDASIVLELYTLSDSKEFIRG
ncbi:MSHA biogenesis protein MshJ [Pseudaeromonas sharmana]|uniref:MSHA biogenesis protein MshJ n=1 Tax=Pseudaeromonas sharmana TaxID=328412 RepID=A0ABV8CL33_9GAMM